MVSQNGLFCDQITLQWLMTERRRCLILVKLVIGLPCSEEIVTIPKAVSIQYRNVTDRRTDRQNCYVNVEHRSLWDSGLTMTAHISKTVSNCFAALRQIRSVRRSLPTHVTLSLVTVRSHRRRYVPDFKIEKVATKSPQNPSSSWQS